MEVSNIFYDFSVAFQKKIDKDYFIKLQFEFIDLKEDDIWQVEVKDGKVLIYNEIKINPEEIFVLTTETITKLYNNDISPLSAFANEPNINGEMCALIDLKDKKPKLFIKSGQEIEKDTLDFIDRLHRFNDFFSKDYPSKIIIKNENCIKLHSVDAIGLFSRFKNGIIHAFFSIGQDECLKQSPIEFSILVLNGEGFIEVENNEYPIAKNEYYSLNPKGHIFIKNRSKETLEILYMGMKT